MTCHVTVTIHKHDPRWCPVERVKLFIAFLYKVIWGVRSTTSASVSSQVPNIGKPNESTRPKASCFYCFEVSGIFDGTWSTSFFNMASQTVPHSPEIWIMQIWVLLKILLGRRCVHSWLCERWQRLLKKSPKAVFVAQKLRVELVKEEHSKVNSLQKKKWAVKVFREWIASRKVEVLVLDPGGAFKNNCELQKVQPFSTG